MNFEEGAMVEPTAVAVQICKVAELRANQTVLVFGAGPIGVLCQAVAKAYGAKKVIGVDISEARLKFAQSYGADQTFLPPRFEGDPVAAAEKVAALIKEKCNLGEGADVVLECTGAEPCIQAGIFAAKKGGTYVQAGMGKEVCSVRYLSTGPLLTGPECRLPNHNCMHSCIEYQRINPIHNWSLSCCGRLDRVWKDRREAPDHEPVQV